MGPKELKMADTLIFAICLSFKRFEVLNGLKKILLRLNYKHHEEWNSPKGSQIPKGNRKTCEYGPVGSEVIPDCFRVSKLAKPFVGYLKTLIARWQTFFNFKHLEILISKKVGVSYKAAQHIKA